MERSEQIDQLAAALAKFQGELEQPKMNSTVKVKTRTGGEYSFKYADLSECKAAAKKPLAENGLAVFPDELRTDLRRGIDDPEGRRLRIVGNLGFHFVELIGPIDLVDVVFEIEAIGLQVIEEIDILFAFDRRIGFQAPIDIDVEDRGIGFIAIKGVDSDIESLPRKVAQRNDLGILFDHNVFVDDLGLANRSVSGTPGFIAYGNLGRCGLDRTEARKGRRRRGIAIIDGTGKGLGFEDGPGLDLEISTR